MSTLWCGEDFDRRKRELMAQADAYYAQHMDDPAAQREAEKAAAMKCTRKMAILCNPNMHVLQQYGHLCFALKTIAEAPKSTDPSILSDQRDVTYFKASFNADEMAMLGKNRVVCSQFDCLTNGLSGAPYHVILYYGLLSVQQIAELMLYVTENGWLFLVRNSNVNTHADMKSVIDFDIKSDDGKTYNFRALQKPGAISSSSGGSAEEKKEAYTIVAEGTHNQYGAGIMGGCTIICMEIVLRVLAGRNMDRQLVDDVLNFLAPIEIERNRVASLQNRPLYTDMVDVHNTISRYQRNMAPVNVGDYERMDNDAMLTYFQVPFREYWKISRLLENVSFDPQNIWHGAVMTAGVYSFALFVRNETNPRNFQWIVFDSHGVPVGNRTSGAAFLRFETKDALDRYIHNRFQHLENNAIPGIINAHEFIGAMVFGLRPNADAAQIRRNPTQDESQQFARESLTIN